MQWSVGTGGHRVGQRARGAGAGVAGARGGRRARSSARARHRRHDTLPWVTIKAHFWRLH